MTSRDHSPATRGFLRIGLTGGIGSGKSVASNRFRELGAVVVDHDELSRTAVAPGSPGLAMVVAAFGSEMVRDDGSLDRAALAETIFGDDDARRELEEIIHPEVRRLAREAQDATVAAAREQNAPPPVIVHDIPLLVETGQAGHFDAVFVVHAPTDLRVQRLIETRGLSADEARDRLAAQAGEAERLEAADLILDGSGTPEHLAAEVDRAWGQILRITH
jgi:dephospho-CoA kinase